MEREGVGVGGSCVVTSALEAQDGNVKAAELVERPWASLRGHHRRRHHHHHHRGAKGGGRRGGGGIRAMNSSPESHQSDRGSHYKNHSWGDYGIRHQKPNLFLRR